MVASTAENQERFLFFFNSLQNTYFSKYINSDTHKNLNEFNLKVTLRLNSCVEYPLKRALHLQLTKHDIKHRDITEGNLFMKISLNERQYKRRKNNKRASLFYQYNAKVAEK